MWRPLLVSAVTLVLIIPSSATYSLPLLGNINPIFNITGPAPKTSEETLNLTFPSWPEQPYSISLQDPDILSPNVYLFIAQAKRFQSSPMVSVSDLQHFLQDFADNIQREHPVPDFVPRYATQSIVDISSYTKWIIDVKEGPFHGRLPTAVALAALDELGKLLRRYGPSRIVWAIREERIIPWAWGSLYIESIEGASLNKSSSNEDGGFQTA